MRQKITVSGRQVRSKSFYGERNRRLIHWRRVYYGERPKQRASCRRNEAVPGGNHQQEPISVINENCVLTLGQINGELRRDLLPNL